MYSYTPTRKYIDEMVSQTNVYATFYFESNKRIIGFRNQYGETFIFAPAKAILVVWVVIFIMGLIIGRLI